MNPGKSIAIEMQFWSVFEKLHVLPGKAMGVLLLIALKL